MTGGRAHTFRCWDLANGTNAALSTDVHKGLFSPDGRTFSAFCGSDEVELWNVTTQQELLTVRRLGGALRGLLFSPDGRLLVGASGLFSASGGLRFYRAPVVNDL